MKKLHIAFIGDLTVDRYVNQNEIHLGGSSLTGALWAMRTGAKCSVVAAVGTDEVGKKYKSFLREHHIHASHIQTLRGNTSIIEIITTPEGDRTYGAWNPGILERYRFAKKDELFIRRHDAVVLTVYGRTRHLLDEFVSQFRKPLRVVDFGDLSDFGKTAVFVQKYLTGIDICIFGLDKDADETLINELQLLAAEEKKIIIVTLAKFGSLAFAGNEVFVQPANDVPVVDTTGAGDAFLAGFLVTYLQSKNIQKALRDGTNLASKVVGLLGSY